MREIVGVIPAGGHATRIAPLPCSKEVYPVGFRAVADGGVRPKVVCHYLLEKMRRAGITKAYMVLRDGKWDIPSYFGDGSLVDMHLAYLMRGLPFGPPYTVDQTYAFVQDAIVAFGFPDILFHPDDAFIQLLSRQASSGADVVLGMFPAEYPHRVDLVDRDEHGRVRRLVFNASQTELTYSWCIAVWIPQFTHFLHTFLSTAKGVAGTKPELTMGEAFQAAIEARLRVEAFPVSDTPYLDIGTPEDLARAVRRFAVEQ